MNTVSMTVDPQHIKKLQQERLQPSIFARRSIPRQFVT